MSAVEFVGGRLKRGEISCVVLVGLSQWGRESFERELQCLVPQLTRASTDDYFWDGARYSFSGRHLKVARMAARDAYDTARRDSQSVLVTCTRGQDIRHFAEVPFDVVVFLPSSRDRAVELGRANNQLWGTPLRVFFKTFEALTAWEEHLHRGRLANLKSVLRVEL
jgi:hypothetical protein